MPKNFTKEVLPSFEERIRRLKFDCNQVFSGKDLEYYLGELNSLNDQYNTSKPTEIRHLEDDLEHLAEQIDKLEIPVLESDKLPNGLVYPHERDFDTDSDPWDSN
jgi:predicted  nucleic acid-binding Zn-ribbon protein